MAQIDYRGYAIFCLTSVQVDGEKRRIDCIVDETFQTELVNPRPLFGCFAFGDDRIATRGPLTQVPPTIDVSELSMRHVRITRCPFGAGEKATWSGPYLTPGTLVANITGDVEVHREIPDDDDCSIFFVGESFRRSSGRWSAVIIRQRETAFSSFIPHATRPDAGNLELLAYESTKGLVLLGMFASRGIHPGELLYQEWGSDYYSAVEASSSDSEESAWGFSGSGSEQE